MEMNIWILPIRLAAWDSMLLQIIHNNHALFTIIIYYTDIGSFTNWAQDNINIHVQDHHWMRSMSSSQPLPSPDHVRYAIYLGILPESYKFDIIYTFWKHTLLSLHPPSTTTTTFASKWTWLIIHLCSHMYMLTVYGSIAPIYSVHMISQLGWTLFEID